MIDRDASSAVAAGNAAGGAGPCPRDVVDRLPLGICAVGADGRVLAANPALERLMGLGADRVESASATIAR